MKKAAIGLHIVSGILRIGGGILAASALALAVAGYASKKKEGVIKKRGKKEE